MTPREDPVKKIVAPTNLEQGQSTTRPSRLNGQFYDWWKTRMYDFILDEDNELWYIVLDGLHVLMNKVKEGDIIRLVPKTRREYYKTDRKKVE